MDEDIAWDDVTWQRVWDVGLDPVERHGIAMAVLRNRPPREAFEGRVALELASRWGRRAVTLSIVYLVWSAFWGALLLKARWWQGVEFNVAFGCTLLGLLAVATCLHFRRRVLRYVDEHRIR
jgi:hypothetical protein